jgi:phage/plasmid primase-like uncharacterized protein
MRLILPLLALLSIAAPAWGQDKCAPYDQVEAMLAAEFQEIRVQQGIVGEGEAMLVIFASPNGETWTAAMVRPDGVACLAAAGSDWVTRSDPAPVQEEGL